MSVYPNTVLIWIFRGKVETETVDWFNSSSRMRQITGCTRANVYRLDFSGELCEYFGNYWRTAKNVPEEIKLAAMLLN